MIVRSWRDTPKRGETDLKWCAYVSHPAGHVMMETLTTGHETESAARAKAAALAGCPELA